MWSSRRFISVEWLSEVSPFSTSLEWGSSGYHYHVDMSRCFLYILL